MYRLEMRPKKKPHTNVNKYLIHESNLKFKQKIKTVEIIEKVIRLIIHKTF